MHFIFRGNLNSVVKKFVESVVKTYSGDKDTKIPSNKMRGVFSHLRLVHVNS